MHCWKSRGDVKLAGSRSLQECVERLRNRVEGNDAEAIHMLAGHYYQGQMGLPKDSEKAKNSGFGQESWGVPRRTTILLGFISRGNAWKGK